MSAIDSRLVDGGGVDTQMSAIEQQQTRTNARRERQIVEIAALAATGNALRATGLALEHAREFPSDAELLARLAPPDV